MLQLDSSLRLRTSRLSFGVPAAVQTACPATCTPQRAAPAASVAPLAAQPLLLQYSSWHSAPLAPCRLPDSPARSVAASAHGTLPEYKLEAKPPARLAVFVSGGGSNFKAIHTAILDGRINATVVAVVSDVPSCGGVAYAAQHGIPTLTYPVVKKGEFQGQGLSATDMVNALKDTHQADFVLLAGYLKLIPAELCRAFPRAMLNIHPGLLPSFGGKGYYGERVHKAVIASGARFTGPTVHFVDEEFDTGPILAQRVVPVYPNDTYKQVAARVLKEEHQVYPHCVAALCDGRIGWREDGIPILWEAK